MSVTTGWVVLNSICIDPIILGTRSVPGFKVCDQPTDGFTTSESILTQFIFSRQIRAHLYSKYSFIDTDMTDEGRGRESRTWKRQWNSRSATAQVDRCKVWWVSAVVRKMRNNYWGNAKWLCRHSSMEYSDDVVYILTGTWGLVIDNWWTDWKITQYFGCGCCSALSIEKLLHNVYVRMVV